MCGGTPSAPKPPPMLPAAPTPPPVRTGEDQAGIDARRRRAASGTGLTGSILTGAQGVQSSAATSQKTLLGQ